MSDPRRTIRRSKDPRRSRSHHFRLFCHGGAPAKQPSGVWEEEGFQPETAPPGGTPQPAERPETHFIESKTKDGTVKLQWTFAPDPEILRSLQQKVADLSVANSQLTCQTLENVMTICSLETRTQELERTVQQGEEIIALLRLDLEGEQQKTKELQGAMQHAAAYLTGRKARSGTPPAFLQQKPSFFGYSGNAR